MQVKAIIFYFLIMITFVSCEKREKRYDKNFYLKVTGLDLPKNAKVIESFDDADGHTGIAVLLSSSQINEFKNRVSLNSSLNDNFWNT